MKLHLSIWEIRIHKTISKVLENRKFVVNKENGIDFQKHFKNARLSGAGPCWAGVGWAGRWSDDRSDYCHALRGLVLRRV
mgnify:CR=1 FL=1